MITLDPVTFTLLILLIVVVTAITLEYVHRNGRREGEKLGAAREAARFWRNFASAQAEADACDEWELSDQKPKEDLPC